MTDKPLRSTEKSLNPATDKPTVSIIIAPDGGTDNNIRHLTGVLNGSEFHFELILPEPSLSAGGTEAPAKNVIVRYISCPEDSDVWAFFNIALIAAKGKYVSFIPGDNLPESSDHLVKYLEEHPRTGCVCNGVIAPPDDSSEKLFIRNLSSSKLKIQLLQSNPYVLTFMLFRKTVLAKNRMTFNEKLGEYVLYDFMAEYSAETGIHLLWEFIKLVRKPEQKTKSLVITHLQNDVEDDIRSRQLRNLIQNPGKEALSLYLKFLRGDMLTNNELTSIYSWLHKLLSANGKKHVYNSRDLLSFFQRLFDHHILNMQLLIRSDRSYILNALIEKFRYTSYLEIGVFDPKTNFDNIACKEKTGVDPEPLREDITGKFSDDFFADLDENKRFDLIFIDGLHHSDQVSRDIANALKHLSSNGTIVCHDMLPEDRDMQTVPRKTIKWMGDCWKSWARLRMTDPGLDMHVIDCDCGVGIIRRGKQTLFESDLLEPDYDFFEANRDSLMNVITVAEFYAGLNSQKVL